jgi:hypothetical protein
MKRHKCSACFKVRYEKYLIKAININNSIKKTRFGHDMWVCKDKECKLKYIFVY